MVDGTIVNDNIAYAALNNAINKEKHPNDVVGTHDTSRNGKLKVRDMPTLIPFKHAIGKWYVWHLDTETKLGQYGILAAVSDPDFAMKNLDIASHVFFKVPGHTS